MISSECSVWMDMGNRTCIRDRGTGQSVIRKEPPTQDVPVVLQQPQTIRCSEANSGTTKSSEHDAGKTNRTEYHAGKTNSSEHEAGKTSKKLV